MTESAITPHILESLRNPSAYPVPTGTVELLQTHVSWLFITDSHVFKLKKPVNFGFLDFSTIEQRRFYCHEELRLNRRLCPDIYERVVELRATAAGASFTDEGSVIDHAVMMKRLPADRMLDRLIESGSVSGDEIRVIARTISNFHSNAPTSPHIAEFGSTEQIRFNWQENFEQTRSFLTSTLPASVRDTIHSYVNRFLDANRLLFSERVENGFIRECDGDIHLGNICLQNNRAFIFDCIEFNERFRCSDTAADIAFLLMDLDYHRRPDLAEAALSEYISASGDHQCTRLVPFYKVYRAFVRGKVESMQLLDSGIAPEARAAAEKRAVRYFRLAQGYCLRDALSPTLFITCGTMGCGKSTLAAQLAFELGLHTYSSDVVRKQLAGITPATAVPAPFGEGIYSPEMGEAAYRRLEKLADAELAAGRSVIIDAAFGSRTERTRFARLAATRQVRFVVLFVTCAADMQQKRLHERSLSGTSVSDGRIELLGQQASAFEAPDDSEGAIKFPSVDGVSEHALNSVLERLFHQ